MLGYHYIYLTDDETGSEGYTHEEFRAVTLCLDAWSSFNDHVAPFRTRGGSCRK